MPFWLWTFLVGLILSEHGETDPATIAHNDQIVWDFLAKYGLEIVMVCILVVLLAWILDFLIKILGEGR